MLWLVAVCCHLVSDMDSPCRCITANCMYTEICSQGFVTKLIQKDKSSAVALYLSIPLRMIAWEILFWRKMNSSYEAMSMPVVTIIPANFRVFLPYEVTHPLTTCVCMMTRQMLSCATRSRLRSLWWTLMELLFVPFGRFYLLPKQF